MHHLHSKMSTSVQKSNNRGVKSPFNDFQLIPNLKEATNTISQNSLSEFKITARKDNFLFPLAFWL